eukprot:gene6593-8756_t
MLSEATREGFLKKCLRVEGRHDNRNPGYHVFSLPADWPLEASELQRPKQHSWRWVPAPTFASLVVLEGRIPSPYFTVFTPTYNRLTTLPRTYASLVAQTDQDFEWLVVDDGSQDGTAELIESWSKVSPFPI